MTDSDKKELEISVPGEWAVKKALGPVLSEIGEDIKRLYAVGRNKLLSAAIRKIENIEDGKTPNLRVTRDVLWNGAFSEDEVCAEYFGGILASSRTDDGKDDSSIQFVDVIKSLSAKQLRLHYVIYDALNKTLTQHQRTINVAKSTDINHATIWMASLELVKVHGINIDTDFNALWRNGLLHEYKTDTEVAGDKSLPYAMAKPTSFGVMLYAAAHNRIDRWLKFPRIDFGSFDGIASLKVYSADLVALKKMAGLPSAEGVDSSSKNPGQQQA